MQRFRVCPSPKIKLHPPSVLNLWQPGGCSASRLPVPAPQAGLQFSFSAYNKTLQSNSRSATRRLSATIFQLWNSTRALSLFSTNTALNANQLTVHRFCPKTKLHSLEFPQEIYYCIQYFLNNIKVLLYVFRSMMRMSEKLHKKHKLTQEDAFWKQQSYLYVNCSYTISYTIYIVYDIV